MTRTKFRLSFRKVLDKLYSKYDFFNCPDKYWAAFAQKLNTFSPNIANSKIFNKKISHPVWQVDT